MSAIVGEHIRELRIRAGFETQRALAKKAGIDKSKLSRLENNKPVNLTLKTLERLAETLDVSVRELFQEPRPEEGAGRGETEIGGTGGGAWLADRLLSLDPENINAKTWQEDVLRAMAALTHALQRGPTPTAPSAARSKTAKAGS